MFPCVSVCVLPCVTSRVNSTPYVSLCFQWIDSPLRSPRIRYSLSYAPLLVRHTMISLCISVYVTPYVCSALPGGSAITTPWFPISSPLPHVSSIFAIEVCFALNHVFSVRFPVHFSRVPPYIPHVFPVLPIGLGEFPSRYPGQSILTGFVLFFYLYTFP